MATPAPISGYQNERGADYAYSFQDFLENSPRGRPARKCKAMTSGNPREFPD